MAVVLENALKENLKSGKLLPVYILVGEDAYLKTLYLEKISKSIADKDDIFNYSKFTAQCNLQEVYDSVMQMPMMSDRKCVILNDYDFKHCSDSDFEKLLTLILETPEETTFILYFDGIEIDLKKGAKFKKLVSACEKNGGMAVELKHRTRAELVKMLCQGALKRGTKMDLAAGNYLVETCGEDINLLSGELEKLCAFVGESAVSKAHIDEVCTPTVEANIFKLSDLIFACDSTKALKMLDELLFLKTKPMTILFNVSAVFVDIYRALCAKQKGLGIKETADAFGYKTRSFAVEKAFQKLGKMDFKKTKLCLDTLVATDKALKSFSANERLLLEEMIIKLIYIISKGEALD
ncbi:MAG: DNA polymerase III subunit delta [Clostridia bacterium]|nr:DNA polymerase III subunit delta [Clostridia bacterium]